MIYITKYMIGDYLERHEIPVKICGKEPWKFFDVKEYGEGEASHEYLYVSHTAPAAAMPSAVPVCILRTLPEEEFRHYESESEEIICLGEEGAVLHALLACFRFYKNWYLTLQECLIKDGKLQTLVDSSLPVFGNPIAVSDIGFQVLAFTREYHSQMGDAESRFIVKNGCHSPEYIHRITKHTAFIENLRNNLGPFSYHYDFLQHESIYCTIWLRGKPVGFLTIVGMNPLRHKASIDAARIFSDILSRAFDMNSTGHIPLSPTDLLLLRILEGKTPGGGMLEDALMDAGLSRQETYTVVHIHMPLIRPNQNLLFGKVYDSL